MSGVVYDTRKDLPPEQLHKLFIAAGWSDGRETPEMIKVGYSVPWTSSAHVVSAWDGERLVGAVRVLSDMMFRSVIYDLVVHPEYQGRGIGTGLVKRCVDRFPNSEFLVQTTENAAGFYEKQGFNINNDIFLTIPCKFFS